MLIESGRPLSQSFIWPLQAKYYQSMGIDAWLSGVIPSKVTTNSHIALDYARLVAAYMNDRGLADYEIVELGAGHGRFGFYCASHLKRMTEEGLLPGCRWRYVLTDVAERNIEFFQRHEAFQELVKERLVDFGCFDAGRDQALTLRESGDVLSAQAPTKHLIVIANYFFDSLPIDVWQAENGCPRPCWTRVQVSESAKTSSTEDPAVLKEIELLWSDPDSTEPTYADPRWNKWVSQIATEVGNGTFTFPTGAYHVLDTIATWSREPLCLLATDKGYPELQNYRDRGLPTLVQHGCFSFNVNFPAIGLWFTSHDGQALLPKRGDGFTETAVYVSRLPTEQTPRLKMQFAQLEQFTSAEYYELIRRCEQSEPDLGTCLSLIKLSCYDPQVFYRLRRAIRSHLDDCSGLQRSLLIDAMRRVQQMYFHLEDDDIPFAIGLIHQNLGEYATALEHYQLSLRFHGEQAVTLLNRARCQRKLMQYDEAKRLLQRCLQLDPRYHDALEELSKLDAEVSVAANATTDFDPDAESENYLEQVEVELREWLAELQVATAQIDLVTDHPWALTYRIETADGDYYAKVLPSAQWGAIPGLERLSSVFTHQVPQVKAAARNRGMILYHDHGGKSLSSKRGAECTRSLISMYGQMQAIAARRPDLLTQLASADLDHLLAEFLSFFDPEAAREESVGADHFLGIQESRGFLQLLAERLEELKPLWSESRLVPPTINHCDFRVQNAAIRADGSLVLFDWDDCLVGPAGMSLHNCFSGCSVPCSLLLKLPKAQSLDAGHSQLLEHYIDTLAGAGYADREAIIRALPSAICAGVMRYIISYGKFPLDDQEDRAVIAGIMRRRLNDLVDLCDQLVLAKQPEVNDLVSQYERSDRHEDVCRILATVVESTDARAEHFSQYVQSLLELGNSELALKVCRQGLDRFPMSAGLRKSMGDLSLEQQDFNTAIDQYRLAIELSGKDQSSQTYLDELIRIRDHLRVIDNPEVVPTIALSDLDLHDSLVHQTKLKLAADLFRSYGTLVIENAFSKSLLESLHTEFLDRYWPLLQGGQTEGALRVGKSRYMMTVELEGAFNTPRLYAASFLTELFPRLLGDDFVLGSLTSVASMPGLPICECIKITPRCSKSTRRKHAYQASQLPSLFHCWE